MPAIASLIQSNTEYHRRVCVCVVYQTHRGTPNLTTAISLILQERYPLAADLLLFSSLPRSINSCRVQHIYQEPQKSQKPQER